MSNLNVFVSSTCYDLSQIRADLYDFITSIGYRPVMSEFNTFPVNPQKNAVDNCIEAVRNEADIFVLVVGNRYGSLIESGKSITNTEYLTAFAKGIPIFVFIDKKTLSALSFWKDNKTGNFSNLVDNTQIFEFISDIRTERNIWSFEFEKAQDIETILKIQLSYLFKESLKIHSRYNNLIGDILRLDISNEAINILLKKDETFEYEFFSKVLLDEMEKNSDYKNDLTYRIHYEPKYFIRQLGEVTNWALNRLSEIRGYIVSLNNVIHDALPAALKEPGVPADLNALFYVAKAYAKLFKTIVTWTIDTRNAILPKVCEDLKEVLANLANDAIRKTWDYPMLIHEQIQKAKYAPKDKDNPPKVTAILIIELNEEDAAKFDEELAKFGDILLQNGENYED